ncbi:unnamed protein product [Echinostoma caproni]|uniref:CBM21 domain-containing protein n=1 Tax=Echinostoma caproni TaxID=27848 RepID=A0A183A745_9TREM|nr:unnamed protein product [Echinostoma caproni]
MYAWTDPNSYQENSVADAPLKQGAELQTCGSDLQYAYPGRLTMSDSSFSPLKRSPVTTINSARLTDTLSLPTFVPFEGRQMFDATPSSESADEIPKPKRSSSLKSTRTPPGTPGQKAVRFADALGLDLATVRHVFDQENPPKIPASATFDLQLDSDECIAKLGAKQFGLCFAQPGAASNFIRRVLNETVCLEDCHVDMPRGILTGTIRVKSLGFEKHIAVRITYNNWVTFFDSQASYVQGSHDGATDRFSFSVVFPDTMVPGDRAQFAIRYETHTGEQFWDNNHGQNYCVTFFHPIHSSSPQSRCAEIVSHRVLLVSITGLSKSTNHAFSSRLFTAFITYTNPHFPELPAYLHSLRLIKVSSLLIFTSTLCRPF